MYRWPIAFIPVAIVAHAEVYMTPEQAAAVIFPAVPLKRRELSLSDEQRKTIEDKSKENVRSTTLTLFGGPRKEVVFIDQVYGKHEFITYAVGVDSSGQVKDVEILEYRETYGQQIRNADWRKQFQNKKAGDELKVGKDIKNISGATLSSTHITAGVRRLLYTYDSIKSQL